MKIKRIGIVSLGLIGGSLLKSLTNKGFELYAVTRNKDTITLANDYCTDISDNLSILCNCDLIFVCSPMSKTVEILDKLESVVSKDAIVCDVCSLKQFVMEKSRPYNFVGTHPMAGTEHCGFEHSFETLFNDAKWVLTPAGNVSSDITNIVESVISSLGAIPVVMSPSEHDRAVALISHMPMVVSQALVSSIIDNNVAKQLAASGFRDTTRLALSNLEMANDMVTLNNENIRDALALFINNVQDLLNSNYKEKIEEIKNYRAEMYNSDGKNISN